MRRKHSSIYQSRFHVGITLLFVALPVVFFILFSKLAHVTGAVLLSAAGISIARLFIAYIIAALLGWLAAILLYRGKRALIALPIFDVLQSFPTFAALPFAVLLWGVSNFTVIFFLIIAMIWPVFFSIISSLKLIKHDWAEAVAVMGLDGAPYLAKFLLPISIPGLITGSIIGLGEGWEALVATEIIVGIKSGLGGFFQGFANNPTITAFGILGLLLIIFSINKLIWLPLLERSHRMMEE